ncbi:MAG: methionine--tRNA ligase [Flavobacteriales bacterium]|nr:methionine--tRNA ligase [Flavobacteriales bacterium]
MARKFTITSALPYANGPLHIGHVAGAYLNADIYVRHLRSKGDDVLWVCGSDEHGAAITIRAQKDGVSPKEVVDRYHLQIEESFKKFGISFDFYHRTSSKLHHQTASDFFLELYKKDSFIEQETEQFFDEETQMFLADRYIKGTCPNCSYTEAYGDQCERCGSALSPRELIDPKSTLSGSSPVLKKTTHWFLPMDRHEDWIKKWLEVGVLDGKDHHDPEQWKKHVLGQCRSWVEAGLQPRAMTRDLSWGVPVPLDQAKDKVLYVWLDAPIGYISATKAWCEEQGKDWKEYWQNEDRQLIHFIGKDNIVFHCIIFPIILKQHGGYNLPVNVPANEFLNLEGDKISTSRNHAVWLHEYLEDFPARIDELRYVLTSILPETKDSEFTWDDYQARVNNELVAILGNFVNRCLVLCGKYYDGHAPDPESIPTPSPELQKLFDENLEEISKAIEGFRFREALQHAMKGARIGNKFLAESEPWKSIKTDPEQTKAVLYTSLELVQHLTLALEPFLPDAVERLKEMLGDCATEVKAGAALGKAAHLFKPVDDQEIKVQKKKLEPTMESEEQTAEVENISFNDFTRMDIRIGTIRSAERVEGADKLLKLQVDIGSEERTVVSGIAEHYTSDEVIEKQVCLLTHLEPRKIRGVMSQGMVLMAEDEEGRLRFVSPDAPIAAGSTVR